LSDLQLYFLFLCSVQFEAFTYLIIIWMHGLILESYFARGIVQSTIAL